MSVTYRSYAIVGVRVVLDHTPVEVRMRGCDHYEVPDGKFCTECGRPAWVVEKVKPDYEDFLWGRDTKGLVVVGESYESNSRYRHGPATQNCYVGIGTEVDMYDNPWGKRAETLPDKATLLSRIREFLEPYELWNSDTEESFGLWAVLSAA